MGDTRVETDSLGNVEVPKDKLWGAQTQRSLEHFSIGKDLIPREMITSYAILKKAAAQANHAGHRLGDQQFNLIIEVCDEILAGKHQDMFPLHVWMTGSGTQFNMNVNEVISNRCCQLAGTPLGSKMPVHPNDHVNMSASSNDTFPVRLRRYRVQLRFVCFRLRFHVVEGARYVWELHRWRQHMNSRGRTIAPLGTTRSSTNHS